MRFVRSSRSAIPAFHEFPGRKSAAGAQGPAVAVSGRTVALTANATARAPRHCVGEMFGACVMIAIFLAVALFGVA